MKLTEYEQEMLDGKFGEPKKKAMQILSALGDSFDAEEMVEVRNVHLAGASIVVTGEAGVKFAESMRDRGGCFVTDTTTNPQALDSNEWKNLGIDESDAVLQKRLTACLADMNAQTASTCIPYMTGNAPRCGEHIAWGESSAVVYANSVLGARTNREGGPSGMSAALTGRTPAYGFHLTKNRYGKHLINVKIPISGVTDYGCLGYFAGRLSSTDTPVFTGIPSSVRPDELKALSAALASSGAVSMFHAVGITPEAATLEVAFGPNTPEIVRDFGEAQRQEILDYLDRELSDKVDWVMIGCPHTSIFELAEIKEKIAGKRIHPDVTFWICTAASIKAMADAMGYTKIIEAAGGIIVCDTCPVLAPTRSLAANMGYTVLTTNSAKMAHYSPGQFGLMNHYGDLDTIIKAAVSGKWVR